MSRWYGPARGPVACVLGPGPWEGFGAGLGALGYRTIRPSTEAEAALSEAGVTEEATLVGHGPGAVEAVILAARRPEMVRRLVLIAPEGFGAAPPPSPWAHRLGRLPLVGPHLTARLSPPAGPLCDEEHRQVAAAGVPVVALWLGEAASLRGPGLLAQWNRTAKQEVLHDLGPDALAAEPGRLVSALRDVLREDWH
ncbi:alpha/beta hydrolase [Rubellimicrobium sp. CFH 75288]|uniref:alpha/beta hydrolase n=1 Tax=Rubellimicrobium sp. CFH 75288 TaxID=2697034 RepID=UPI00141253F6|nr:alpha/beta hydrolase [Rubellimicrobium sp. CFH 75288]NAZ37521.1 hypothetical protein [Rubellimicrobium sp. CFH 75288]